MATDKGQVDRRQIILFSLFFLFYFGGVGLIQPFITLHFHKIGMTGLQIGGITTISGLLVLVAAPLLGGIYDRIPHKRTFFQVVMTISGVFLFLVGQSQYFWIVLALYTLYRFGGASTIPTAENLAYSVAKGGGSKRHSFGYMRLWGSIGFSISALAGGWIVEKVDIQINFLLFLILLILGVGLISFVPTKTFKYTEKTTVDKETSKPSVLRIILKDKYLWLMVTALAITYPVANGIRNFEPIYMDQLNVSESMIGLAATLSALGEVPFMLWADQWISRVGITRILLFVFFIDLLRRLFVWFFPFGWMVVIMHVATSVSFSLRLITTVSMVNQRVPREFTTTALALITMTLFGISNMASNAISGLIFDNYGGRELYLLSAAGCLLSLGLAIWAASVEKKNQNNNQVNV
jgi:MFS family permease